MKQFDALPGYQTIGDNLWKYHSWLLLHFIDTVVKIASEGKLPLGLSESASCQSCLTIMLAIGFVLKACVSYWYFFQLNVSVQNKYLSVTQMLKSKCNADHISVQINMAQYLQYFVIRL